MSVAELAPTYTDLVAFHGIHSTGYEGAAGRTADVGGAFKIPPDDHVTIILDLPAPQHIQEHVAEGTLVVGDHGDGGRKASMEAVTGIVLDNPEASANNFKFHQALIPHTLYVPLAGGNANNFALSALGSYAQNPQLLATAQDVYIGEHRPLLYSVTDERDEVVRYGCASTCVGIGGAAVVAAALDAQKSTLKELSQKTLGKERRVLKEIATTTAELMKAEPFSAEVTVTTDGEPATENFDALTGLEVVGSHIYAKQGRTRVNVGDTKQQVVVSRHHAFKPAQLAGLLAVSARLKTGIHPKKHQFDFAHTQMSIRPTSGHVVPFHVEGEIGPAYQLEPGQTLHLRLARIAIPVLMRK